MRPLGSCPAPTFHINMSQLQARSKYAPANVDELEKEREAEQAILRQLLDAEAPWNAMHGDDDPPQVRLEVSRGRVKHL